jgi:DNA-binding MarR family transcriptional regulator
LGNFTVTRHVTDVNITNIETLDVLETITIQNNQNDTSFLYFWINQSFFPSSLKILNSEKRILPYERVDTSNLYNISLHSQFNSSKETTILFFYRLNIQLDPVSKNPTYYIFNFYQHFSYQTYYYKLFVRLPIDSYLHEGSNPIPEGWSQFYSQRWYIEWDFNEIIHPFDHKSFAIYFDESLKPRPIWGYIVGPLLGMIAGAVIVYLLMRRGSSRLEEEIEKIYLTKNQQILLKLINEKEGKMTQQDIVKITNFTKSKVSRNLTPLEENGLIAKEKWGREYKVRLTKKGQKVVQKIVAEELQNSEVLNQPDISKEEKTK